MTDGTVHHHILAQKKGFGQVSMCQNCDDVHLSFDRLSVRISKQELIELSDMLLSAIRHPKICFSQKNPREFMGSQLFSRA